MNLTAAIWEKKSAQKVIVPPSFIPSHRCLDPSLSSPPPMLHACELAIFDKMTDEHLKEAFIPAYMGSSAQSLLEEGMAAGSFLKLARPSQTAAPCRDQVRKTH